MSLRVEAWLTGGVLRGLLACQGHLRDALEHAQDVVIERSTWAPIGSLRPEPAGDIRVPVDDLVLMVSEQEIPGPVHAAWHPIRLVAGPWLIHGDLATMPGFDPGRALTRPTGEFVLLAGVRVALRDQPETTEVAHAQALVNRYAIDEVQADLMLGFFFPGAHMELALGEEPALPGALPGAIAAGPAGVPQPAERLSPGT